MGGQPAVTQRQKLLGTGDGKGGRERELTCVEDLLCTKHCAGPVTCTLSLDPHGKAM